MSASLTLYPMFAKAKIDTYINKLSTTTSLVSLTESKPEPTLYRRSPKR